MTAKEWLMRGWKLNREIDRLIASRDAVKAKVLTVTASPDAVVVDGTKDPHKFDRLAAYEDDLNRRIDEYVDIMDEIGKAIHELEDRRYRLILIDRYQLFKQWEQIAVDEGYNIRHVWRLHGEALIAMEGVIPKTE